MAKAAMKERVRTGSYTKKKNSRERQIGIANQIQSDIRMRQFRERVAIYNYISSQESRDIDRTIQYLDRYVLANGHEVER